MLAARFADKEQLMLQIAVLVLVLAVAGVALALEAPGLPGQARG